MAEEDAGAGAGAGAGTGDAAAAAAAAAAGAGAGAAPTWRETLPKEYAENPAFKNFESQEDVYRSYAHLRQMQGLPPERVAKRPGDDAPAEEWNKYYDFNGRPAKADGYKAPTVEGFEFNKDSVTKAAERAHKLGMNQKQFGEWLTDMAQDAISGTTAQNKNYNDALEATNTKLKAEWGAAFEDRSNAIKSFLKSTGDDSLQAHLEEAGFGADERMMKFLGQIAGQWRETGAVGGQGGGSGTRGPMTSTDAKAEIKELEGTPEFMGRYKKGDADAMAKMDRLYKFAYPEQKR